MKAEIVKVSRDDLALFLRQHGELWTVDGDFDFEGKLSHFPASVDELIDACNLYAPDSDYVYVFSDADPADEIVARGGVHSAATITTEELEQYIVRTVKGSDFLWIAVSDEDAFNASVTTILRYEDEDDVEDPSEEDLSHSSGASLTGIQIENFKGIREPVQIELRPLTLLFGTNSAGKSSILHALQYANEVFERRNLDAGLIGEGVGGVDLGGFQNFVHGHDPNRDVSLGFHLALSLPSSIPGFNSRTPRDVDDPSSLYGFPRSAFVSVTIGWSNLLLAPFVRRYSVKLDDVELAEIIFEPGSPECELLLNERHPTFVRNSDHSSLALWHPLEVEDLGEGTVIAQLLSWAVHTQAIQGRGPGEAPYTSSYGLLGLRDSLPDFDRPLSFDSDWDWGGRDPQLQTARIPELSDYLTEAISQVVLGPGRILRDLLTNSRFLGPIREVPQRNRTPSRQQERSRWSSGLGAWDRLETADAAFIDYVSHWLGDENRLNSGYRLRLKRFKELDLSDPLVVQLLTGRAFDDAEIGTKVDLSSVPTQSRVLIVPIDSSVELRPNDVGIGISQVVPVIVTALDGAGRFVAIEQPELHIHPKLQAEIADLFLEASQKQQHRFLIETHSEHCVLRLQRRIRETTKGKPVEGRSLMSEDVVVYHVSSDGNGTRIRRIDVDRNGEFVQPWPDDFFEIDFYERFGHDR